MDKKIVIVNKSDSIGGAAIVSTRLMRALRKHHVDASMLVADKSVDDPNIHKVESSFSLKAAFLLERLKIFLRNGFDRPNLFKVDTGDFGVDLTDIPEIKRADIVCLNWINQGFISLRQIQRLLDNGKRIIWTMHDMWNATAICHHAGDCEQFLDHCANCRFSSSLSASTFAKKRKLYNSDKITFVAVSNWLANQCRKSALLRHADIRVIPNAFPIDTYDWRKIGNDKIILMGAARLDDTTKGISYAIEALNILHKRAIKAKALFFGNINDKSLLDKITLDHQYLGPVESSSLPQLYQRADIVLSTSLYETLPGTLIEGMAAGCTPVSFGIGGQTDIFDHNTSGYIAQYLNPVDVADCLAKAISSPFDRFAQHSIINDRFSADTIAKSYINLFTENN